MASTVVEIAVPGLLHTGTVECSTFFVFNDCRIDEYLIVGVPLSVAEYLKSEPCQGLGHTVVKTCASFVLWEESTNRGGGGGRRLECFL